MIGCKSYRVFQKYCGVSGDGQVCHTEDYRGKELGRRMVSMESTKRKRGREEIRLLYVPHHYHLLPPTRSQLYLQ